MSYGIFIKAPGGECHFSPHITWNLREALDVLFNALDPQDADPVRWTSLLASDAFDNTITTSDCITLHLKLANMRVWRNDLLPKNRWGNFDNLQTFINEMMTVCLDHGYCTLEVR